ncbi:MAG: Nif3-like dinuclear metal center hexameric protein [Clostridia bacterium]|nr:Nif3-like dinuclear metal center hexameric protein [Clostridia bacterium]
MKVKDILDCLEKLYPSDTACDFDNVGLLAGDSEADITGAVVALDCDVNTISFAKETDANLIITHHPVILDPVKSVTENDIVYKLISNGISVICMHTNLDVGKGGVNDSLCNALALKHVRPHIAADGYCLKCGKTDIRDPDSLAVFIKEKLGGTVKYVCGKKPVKTVLVCSGSGGGYIDEAITGGFDALITADVKQHQFIAAINAGVSLFDGGHYNTENVVIAPLCERLSRKFTDTNFTPFFNSEIKSV